MCNCVKTHNQQPLALLLFKLTFLLTLYLLSLQEYIPLRFLEPFLNSKVTINLVSPCYYIKTPAGIRLERYFQF